MKLKNAGEPNPLTALARQLEQIKADERQAAQDCINAIAVGQMREEIRRHGREPCA